MWFKDNDDDQILNKCYLFLLYISGVLYFLSTCINPLLYNILSHKFRNAFKVSYCLLYSLQIHNYKIVNFFRQLYQSSAAAITERIEWEVITVPYHDAMDLIE